MLDASLRSRGAALVRPSESPWVRPLRAGPLLFNTVPNQSTKANLPGGIGPE